MCTYFLKRRLPDLPEQLVAKMKWVIGIGCPDGIKMAKVWRKDSVFVSWKCCRYKTLQFSFVFCKEKTDRGKGGVNLIFAKKRQHGWYHLAHSADIFAIGFPTQKVSDAPEKLIIQ